MVDSQPGWTEQSVDRPMATPKYYMTDSGLAAYLQGLDREEDLSRNTECVKNGVGSLTATWVYNQLRSEINRHAGWEFSYLRTRKHDINFIVANEVGRLLAVKVKATESVMPNDYKDLHWFARLVGEDNCRGVVLYAGHRVRSGGQGCYALPMSALWSDFSTWEKW